MHFGSVRVGPVHSCSVWQAARLQREIKAANLQREIDRKRVCALLAADSSCSRLIRLLLPFCFELSDQTAFASPGLHSPSPPPCEQGSVQHLLFDAMITALPFLGLALSRLFRLGLQWFSVTIVRFCRPRQQSRTRSTNKPRSAKTDQWYVPCSALRRLLCSAEI